MFIANRDFKKKQTSMESIGGGRMSTGRMLWMRTSVAVTLHVHVGVWKGLRKGHHLVLFVVMHHPPNKPSKQMKPHSMNNWRTTGKPFVLLSSLFAQMIFKTLKDTQAVHWKTTGSLEKTHMLQKSSRLKHVFNLLRPMKTFKTCWNEESPFLHQRKKNYISNSVWRKCRV